MATTLADVRTALAQAASAAGLNVAPYETDTIVTPCGYVTRRSFDPRMVFNGATTVYAFAVLVYVNRTDERSAQEFLDRLAEVQGEQSLRAAIENEDGWPDGLVQYAQVVRIGEQGTYEIAGVSYLGFQIDCEVCF